MALQHRHGLQPDDGHCPPHPGAHHLRRQRRPRPGRDGSHRRGNQGAPGRAPQHANYSVEGRYLLSGLSTGVRPFERDASGNVVYMGNTGKVSYEMEKGVIGDVSFHGREIFPVEYTSNTLTSVEVPSTSPGRAGTKFSRSPWQPERQGSPLGRLDRRKHQRHRRPHRLQPVPRCRELNGLTLDRIAELINESLNMGDASRLLSVSVEKNMAAGTQRLVFTSHTGEPIQVTGWPDTTGCSRPRPSSASTPRRGLPPTAPSGSSSSRARTSPSPSTGRTPWTP